MGLFPVMKPYSGLCCELFGYYRNDYVIRYLVMFVLVYIYYESMWF